MSVVGNASYFRQKYVSDNGSYLPMKALERVVYMPALKHWGRRPLQERSRGRGHKRQQLDPETTPAVRRLRHDLRSSSHAVRTVLPYVAASVVGGTRTRR